jgi:hypothetical protein
MLFSNLSTFISHIVINILDELLAQNLGSWTVYRHDRFIDKSIFIRDFRDNFTLSWIKINFLKICIRMYLGPLSSNIKEFFVDHK